MLTSNTTAPWGDAGSRTPWTGSQPEPRPAQRHRGSPGSRTLSICLEGRGVTVTPVIRSPPGSRTPKTWFLRPVRMPVPSAGRGQPRSRTEKHPVLSRAGMPVPISRPKQGEIWTPLILRQGLSGTGPQRTLRHLPPRKVKESNPRAFTRPGVLNQLRTSARYLPECCR